MEKNLEYSTMAKFYDKFYQNKNYYKEVGFIEKVVNNKGCKILDAGCGTGRHAEILHNNGYIVSGFDLSKEMVDIANQKVNGCFEVGNILNYKSDEKFDVVISFYAVFNHLKNYKQFALALKNLVKVLNPNGKIIIDLHNPHKNGCKVERVDDLERTMKWRICRLLDREYTKIKYDVDGRMYLTSHVFKIFKISKLKKICEKFRFKSYEFYENYNLERPATNKSKNIQLVINV